VQQGRRALQVVRVLLVRKAAKDLKDSRAFKEQRVAKALQVVKDHRVSKVFRVLQDRKVLRVVQPR
jgi:hypothetical protein